MLSAKAGVCLSSQELGEKVLLGLLGIARGPLEGTACGPSAEGEDQAKREAHGVPPIVRCWHESRFSRECSTSTPSPGPLSGRPLAPGSN